MEIIKNQQNKTAISILNNVDELIEVYERIEGRNFERITLFKKDYNQLLSSAKHNSKKRKEIFSLPLTYNGYRLEVQYNG